MTYSKACAAIGHALFLLAAVQGLQAAPFAYVVENGASNVKVIDTANDAVMANIPVGRSPRGVAVNAAGTRAYVTNSDDATVSTIDTTTNRVVATTAVGRGPIGVAVNFSGTRVYVANTNSETEGTVSVIDAATNAVIASIRVGTAPRGLALTPDGTRLYVANVMSNSISVIDTATHLPVATIAVGSPPEGALAVDAAGSRIYAALPFFAGLIVIDASTHTIVGSERANWDPTGIALSPDGTRAYVADSGSDFFIGKTVHVIDTASLAVVAKVPVGTLPLGISMHPSGERVYVTNVESNTVSVIDAATNTVINTIAVGRWPTSLAIGPANAALAAGNYQGLWWNSPAGSESGWGVNLTHQGDILFATWFTYDTDGSSLWLAMSNGAKTGPTTYSGTLYRATGPSFNANPWNPADVTRTPVGSATFAFTGADDGNFTYTLNGVTQSKAITRLKFSSPVPTCTAGGTPGAPPNYQDLWWRSPAGSESGWGVNITHQGDILFATWFTYDASSKGQWLVMSNGARIVGGTYSGTLYRTTGPAFDANPWRPAQVTTTPVGTATFSFSDADNGTFAYALDGMSGSHPITRQAFSSPRTVCR